MDGRHPEERQGGVQEPGLFGPEVASEVGAALAGLPQFEGRGVLLEWAASMRAHRGRLHSGPGPGLEVHAASFIRERRMVLGAELRKRPSELRRILVHELFHFVWARLGNPARRQYLALLESECAAGARGELGWSSEMRKRALARAPLNSRAWREYACESFCDTAAWLWARRASHGEFTLKPRFKNARARWFSQLSGHRQGAFRI